MTDDLHDTAGEGTPTDVVKVKTPDPMARSAMNWLEGDSSWSRLFREERAAKERKAREEEESRQQRVQDAIAEECDSIRELLLSKNRQYGSAFLGGSTAFTDADPVERLRVRIGDKLDRIETLRRHGPELDDDGEVTESLEDTERDLIGYLVLLRVARRLR